VALIFSRRMVCRSSWFSQIPQSFGFERLKVSPAMGSPLGSYRFHDAYPQADPSFRSSHLRAVSFSWFHSSPPFKSSSARSPRDSSLRFSVEVVGPF